MSLVLMNNSIPNGYLDDSEKDYIPCLSYEYVRICNIIFFYNNFKNENFFHNYSIHWINFGLLCPRDLGRISILELLF